MAEENAKHIIWMAPSKMPEIKDDDLGIWRRLFLCGFLPSKSNMEYNWNKQFRGQKFPVDDFLQTCRVNNDYRLTPEQVWILTNGGRGK